MKGNILILTSEFPPLAGGIGNHAFHLAKYLQQAGYEITVLTDYRSVDKDKAFDKGQPFQVLRVKRTPFVYFSRILKALNHTKTNTTVIASGKFPLWLGGMLSLVYPKKQYIAVLHGSELRAGGVAGQALTRRCLKRFHKLIAVSRFTKKRALSINPALKIEVIHNGIELHTPTTLSSPNKEPLTLITVGHLSARKGQQNVIKALPLLKKQYPNIHYHCVGIPTELGALKTLAQTNDVAAQVTFHGALAEDEKTALLQKSTVFIMLSEQVKNDIEGFGIAVLEANALGLPAIGSLNTGLEDAISEGYSGRLVDPHRPDAIVTALLDIMANYETYSQNAREWASRFEWKLVIKHYLNVIES